MNRGCGSFLQSGEALAVLSPERFETLWKSAPRTARFPAAQKSNAVARLGFDVVHMDKIDYVASQYCPPEDIVVWRKDAVRMKIFYESPSLQFFRWTGLDLKREWDEEQQQDQRWLEGRVFLTGNFFFVSPWCMRIKYAK